MGAAISHEADQDDRAVFARRIARYHGTHRRAADERDAWPAGRHREQGGRGRHPGHGSRREVAARRLYAARCRCGAARDQSRALSQASVQHAEGSDADQPRRRVAAVRRRARVGCREKPGRADRARESEARHAELWLFWHGEPAPPDDGSVENAPQARHHSRAVQGHGAIGPGGGGRRRVDCGGCAAVARGRT